MKIIMFSGSNAAGKTAVLKNLIPYFRQKQKNTCACKIDCLETMDDKVYQALGIPHVVGLSKDICPDHFLVSNLPELWGWADSKNADYLLIETAGLCHRCSPATKKIISVCVLDSTASCHAPEKLGPMLTKADMIVLTKIDMVSQAEREIITWKLSKMNGTAEIFLVDGLAGYGIELLGKRLLAAKDVDAYENDLLRHTMPSGICSYCLGEQRVGSAYQQGVVGKIDFGGAT